MNMVSTIVLIAKKQPQYTVIVKAEDWLNPKMYCMDAQEAYTGESTVILKDHYKVGWILGENGEVNYF